MFDTVRLPRKGHVPEHCAAEGQRAGFTWTTPDGSVFVPFSSVFAGHRYNGEMSLWHQALLKLKAAVDLEDPAIRDSLPGSIIPAG